MWLTCLIVRYTEKTQKMDNWPVTVWKDIDDETRIMSSCGLRHRCICLWMVGPTQGEMWMVRKTPRNNISAHVCCFINSLMRSKPHRYQIPNPVSTKESTDKRKLPPFLSNPNTQTRILKHEQLNRVTCVAWLGRIYWVSDKTDLLPMEMDH